MTWKFSPHLEKDWRTREINEFDTRVTSLIDAFDRRLLYPFDELWMNEEAVLLTALFFPYSRRITSLGYLGVTRVSLGGFFLGSATHF